MKWGRWSTTAASNSTAPPDGWPEGQAPSTVNDCAREMMAAIRTGLNDVIAGFQDLDFSPVQTGSTTFTMPNDQTGYFHYGVRVRASDASILYGTVISASFTTNTGVTLRLDSGVLTSSLSAMSVGIPQLNSPLPQQAFNNENILLNAKFEVFTRTATLSISTGLAITRLADEWLLSYAGLSTGTAVAYRAERSANASNVPTLAQCGELIQQSFAISVGTALTVVGANDTFNIQQRIEGARWAPFAHKPLVANFWVNSTLTGTYCCSLRGAVTGGGTVGQSFVREFQISAASTWERKIITFPEAPTSGTWDYSFGIGLILTMALVTGSSIQGGADNWTAINIIATSNQVNFFGASGRRFMMSKMVLQEGVYPTPVPFTVATEEQLKTERHLQRFTSGRWGGHALNAGSAIFTIPTAQPMRGGASLSASILTTAAFIVVNSSAVNQSVSSTTVITILPQHLVLRVDTVGATGLGSSGDGCELVISAGGVIIFKSEP